MNQASLYHKANKVQRHDSEQIIREFSGKLQWRLDGSDSLLDVGCGPGDVLMDFLYTIMPPNFERVVGVDISAQMVDYAKDVYKTKEKCDFIVFDIGTENDIPKNLSGKFDHITSFYCLHWVKDQKQSLNNIFQLLKNEGGDCLLVVLAQHPIFDAYKVLAKSPKWSKYMTNLEHLTTPWHFVPERRLRYASLLNEVGFSDIQVEERTLCFDYKNIEAFKDNFKAVNPFIDHMPQELHGLYLEELTNAFLSLDLNKNDDSKKFNMPYKLLVIYAKKPPVNGFKI